MRALVSTFGHGVCRQGSSEGLGFSPLRSSPSVHRSNVGVDLSFQYTRPSMHTSQGDLKANHCRWPRPSAAEMMACPELVIFSSTGEFGPAIQVDWIGCTCATFYGGIIPCFLAFLFAKQHVTMRQSKIFSVHAHRVPKEVTLQLQVISNEECLKDRLFFSSAQLVLTFLEARELELARKNTLTWFFPEPLRPSNCFMF